MHSLITVFVLLTESLLLTPDVLESPELKRVRLVEDIPVIPSVVFDSESDRICFADPLASICDGKLPTGRVRDR